jgi:hypothetical protein
MMRQTFEELIAETEKANLYAVEERPNRWACIRKRDCCFLTKGQHTKVLALGMGLRRNKEQEAIERRSV